MFREPMARSHLGVALAVAGALLLGFAGVTYGRAAIARDDARETWERALAHDSRRQAEQVSLVRSDFRPQPGAPLARLIIPSIALDEIVVEGVGNDELNAGPGHLPASVQPGAAGNAVISAHRDRHFSNLDRLRVGDTLTTETLQGSTRWVIVSRRIVDADSRVLVDRGRTELTLTTCWPVRWIGPAPDRLVLAARPVGPAPVRHDMDASAPSLSLLAEPLAAGL